jgi:hypothetical protein
MRSSGVTVDCNLNSAIGRNIYIYSVNCFVCDAQPNESSILLKIQKLNNDKKQEKYKV